jgi:N-acetylneuraminate synthase
MKRKTFIIAELGINHNGNLKTAKELIAIAAMSGCDAVKLQTRNVNVIYSKEELDAPRESPFGITNGDLKHGLEFDIDDYKQIDSFCKKQKIEWFSSAWNLDSFLFLKQFNCKYNKVASAMLGHEKLLTAIAKEKKHTFISTGMCTLKELDHVVDMFKYHCCPFELMHCNSAYPMPVKDANLLMIDWLKNRYKVKVGYSGHESGIIVSCAAVALGASSIERHITLDRAMFGSDQAASLEPGGLLKMVSYIRSIEESFGNTDKIITETEKVVREKLRYYEKDHYKKS